MSFWEKQGNPQPPQDVSLDEAAVAELQEDPVLDIFEEEEENTAELMSDANLRLEQGRLYQMVLQGDIFAETNADPRAIKNVQREIRKFVRERMETMLGIRQEQIKMETIVSSPFNDMEVTVLKMLASKMSKGATEQQQNVVPPTSAQPKKDGITSISGNLRPQATAKLPETPPIKAAPKPQAKPQQQQKPAPKAKSAIQNATESALTKPIDQMTPEELAAHNKAAEERSKRNKAALPSNLVPHPTPQALEMMYMNLGQNINLSSMRPYRLE